MEYLQPPASTKAATQVTSPTKNNRSSKCFGLELLGSPMRSGNNSSKAKKAENVLPKVTIKTDRLKESIQSTNKPVSEHQTTKRQSLENVKST